MQTLLRQMKITNRLFLIAYAISVCMLFLILRQPVSFGSQLSEAAAILIVIFLFILVMGRSITTPLYQLSEQIKCIADGSTAIVINEAGKDEISDLAADTSGAVSRLNSMLDGVRVSGDRVLKSVDLLDTVVKRSSEGARKQVGHAELIATAAEEMSRTIADIAQNTAIASDTAAEAADVAQAGQELAVNAVQTVNRVSSSTDDLAVLIAGLNIKVSEIGGIVIVIKEIADQTNLLALNAAIEAARAGEQGRGFAVVADEVRKLAERTIKATSEISSKIQAVQTESGQTTECMKDASAQVRKASEYIQGGIGNALEAIVATVDRVRDQVIHIATAVEQQSTTSAAVVSNIEITTTIAREMQATSDQVTNEVEELLRVAGRFKSAGLESRVTR